MEGKECRSWFSEARRLASYSDEVMTARTSHNISPAPSSPAAEPKLFFPCEGKECIEKLFLYLPPFFSHRIESFGQRGQERTLSLRMTVPGCSPALSRSTLFSNSQLHSRPRILPLALFPGLSYRLLSVWIVFLTPVLFLRQSVLSVFGIR